MRENGTCPRCSLAEETVLHAIFECPDASLWWDTLGWSNLLAEAPSSTFSARLLWAIDKLEMSDLSRFLETLWALWTVRNDVVINQVSPNPAVIIHGFIKMVSEFHSRNESQDAIRTPENKTTSF